MPTLREELDTDRLEDWSNVSDARSERTPYELNCSLCNRTLYVDEATRAGVNRAVQTGLENPLVCGECSAEYEELAHQAC